MKKIFTLFWLSSLLCSGSVYAEYATPGQKSVFTFSSLSTLEGSGVTKNGNEFIVTDALTITAGDTLRMDNNATVKLANGVYIYIEGYGDLVPQDTATITRLDEEAKPKGIYFNADDAEGQMKNITLEYGGLRYNGKKSFTIDNCTFRLIGTAHTSGGAIALGDGGKTIIRNCNFISNESAAISSGANQQHGITFTDNYLYDNNTKNSNRPQINITSPGNAEHYIARNSIIGTQRTKVGGIGISNMLGMSGANKVTVEDNYITGCRYGLTFMGPLDIIVKNNRLVDNKYEPDPNNGGSGISIYDSSKKLKAVITGNLIEKHLWGITVLGGADVNIGKLDPLASDYNPGGNVFIDNGNNNALYDLYNNTDMTIYAQGNTWNVDEQTPEKIENVIYHKIDNPALGEVIYQYQASGIETANTISVYYNSYARILKSEQRLGHIRIYNMVGTCIFESRDIDSSEIQIPESIKGTSVVEVINDSGLTTLKVIL